MLIYNANREFLGIDEKDLKTLGFKSFLGLQTEANDFADFFVKIPGYIHNFKHVHWIDFIICSESNEVSQAIINANGKNFKCKINIETLFLAQNPSAPSYIVNLNNLIELTKKESENISADIANRPTIINTLHSVSSQAELITNSYSPPDKKVVALTDIKTDSNETSFEIDLDYEEDFAKNVSQPINIIETQKEMFDVGDLSLDENIEVIKSVTSQNRSLYQESFSSGYVYDPEVASYELGLPLDLIEEFVQDFIVQAQEFEASIYEALDSSSLEQVKILSHKLKGVAANLRIEDALESLAFVNTSGDISVIKENLDNFYKIIAKLSRKENQENSVYESIFDVDDSQASQKIEPPELVDEKLTDLYVDFSKFDVELKEIENMETLELEKKVDFLIVDEGIKKQEDLPILYYSKERVAAEIGIDIESFRELFEDYLQESYHIVERMRDYAAMSDLRACAYEAMKLQGMSDNLRIESLKNELEDIVVVTNKDELISLVDRVAQIILHISRTGV